MLFRLYLWKDRLLLLGPGFDTGLHRHHAAQLCVGLDRSLRIRGDEHQPWQQAPAFFIPADRPHQFDATDGAVAMLYLDTEGSEGRDCRARYGKGISRLQASAPAAALAGLYQRGGTLPQAQELTQQLIGRAAAPAAPLDPRVTQAVDWIVARLQSPVRIADVAAAVHLSESHLAHLFAEQIGVPLRRYVLWRRLRAALDLAIHGASLTTAAHEAGFADSAHLSRTFRDNFGVAPSLLFEHRERIDLHCG